MVVILMLHRKHAWTQMQKHKDRVAEQVQTLAGPQNLIKGDVLIPLLGVNPKELNTST